MYKPNPKAEGEQKFIKKHVTIKKDDPAGNKDDVFNATNVKAIDRRKDDHGYNPGEDAKVYEAKAVDPLTDEEMSEREKIVKGMKKNFSSFKAKYGEKAKGVMYATATKMANEEVESDGDMTEVEIVDALQGIFEHLDEEGLEYVEQLIAEENEEELESFISEAFDVLDESMRAGMARAAERDWVSTSSGEESSARHHLVKNGRRLSSHETEKQAVDAWRKMDDNKGVKIVKEEITEYDLDDLTEEQLDELSYDTLHSYMRKAGKQLRKDNYFEAPPGSAREKRIEKRVAGYRRAWQKRDMKEDVEQIDELKKSTMVSYVRKATADAQDTDRKLGSNMATNDFSPEKTKNIIKGVKRSTNRLIGIRRAAHKLAKEEVEQIDELSKDTIRSYAAKKTARMSEYGGTPKSDKDGRTHQNFKSLVRASMRVFDRAPTSGGK
jgi:hypothetical protein